MVAKNRKARTYARTRAISRRGNEKQTESDGTYFLKLVLCVVLGTVWLKLGHPIMLGNLTLNGIPIGLLFGLFIVSKFEKFQTDRKIWYALLVIVAIVSYFLPSGIII